VCSRQCSHPNSLLFSHRGSHLDSRQFSPPRRQHPNPLANQRHNQRVNLPHNPL
jgi:hypothetical protein